MRQVSKLRGPLARHDGGSLWDTVAGIVLQSAAAELGSTSERGRQRGGLVTQTVYLYGSIGRCLLPPRARPRSNVPSIPPRPRRSIWPLSASVTATAGRPRRSFAAFKPWQPSSTCRQRAVARRSGARPHSRCRQLHEAKASFPHLRFRARALSSHAQGLSVANGPAFRSPALVAVGMARAFKSASLPCFRTPTKQGR
jgi:hypothetical protein